MTTATSLPRVPEGLRDLMKVYTKEVLREKPADLYGFSANFFNVIVGEKSQKAVRKYEPVQTYETIMKNRIRQQVPLSLVFNIIPEKLTDLIKQFIKAVLREKPENIYIFAQEYFDRMSKEKSGRIEYTKYSTYEKSLKDKETVTPGSKVTCECGRILSGKTKDVENRYTDTKLAEADQRTFSSRITYLQSVVIIQRRIRQFLKERKIGRDKDNCNSLEYVTAILLIQRQVRRLLAKKRVEELKNARDVRKPNAKFNTGDYMKAVVVIQRHYRIYLRKKQEQNRLKNDPVSLVTAAIIIQRAFRRMVALQRAKRNTSSATDQAEELNDNASETGSYTSVSTALLSTESTELGMATYEERVHQKIIHEDEEVENNNVDAGLEKEFLAEPIKGQEKSIHLRKSEILSGALIETMIRKPSLENLKDFHSESKDFEADLEIEADKNEISQDLEPEIKNIKESPDLESIPQAELKAEKKSEELDSESTTKQDSLDAESEGQDEIKIESDTQNLEIKNESEIVTENLSKDVIDQETGEFIESELPNNIEKKESDDGKDNDKKEDTDTPDDGHNEEHEAPVIVSNEIIPSPKVMKSESQETPIKNEVTPTVSIEIEHVDDISEDSPPNFQGSNVDSAKDSSEGNSKEQESTNLSNVEIDSSTTVLVNHNRETREQESPMETSDDTILETSADAVTGIEENKSTIEDEINPKPREKRSIEDDKLVNSNLETTNQTIIKEDIIPIVKSEIKPINQEEIQISNDQELKDEIISSSAEKNNVQEPLEAVAEPSVQEITADSQIEETITENKGDSEESKDVVKPNSQPEDEPDITSGGDASDLSKNERKEVSADDLKLTETDVKLHPETNRLKENLESSTDEPNHAVEKVPTEDASEETQIIQKLSEQETIPIGSDSLETEETVPSHGNINKDKSGESNDDFHNFDVFTEGTDLKEKENLSGSSRTKGCTGEAASSDINDSMGESILIASTSLEDPSVEHELESPKQVVSEGYDSLKNIMDDISSSARELQQIIKTSNIPTERLQSSQAEDQDQETLLINSESKKVEIKKLEDDPDVLSKIKSEEAITPTEDQQSGKETLTINSETMKDQNPKLEEDPVQLVKVLTEGSKSSQAEDQQSDYETLTVNSESKPVEDSNIEGESLKINSGSKPVEDSNLEVESADLTTLLTKGSETSQIETEQSDKEDIPTKSESVQAEDSNIVKDCKKLNSIHIEDSEALNTKDRKPNSDDERTESTEKVLSSSQDDRSPSAIGDSPKSEEEDLEFPTEGKVKDISGRDKLLNSVDQRIESMEKAVSALPDKNSSSTIKDGLKSGDDVEYPTKGHGKEMSVADTAIAVMELSPENKTEAINAPESEGTEAEDNSANESAVPPTLAADKDKPDSDVEKDIKDECPTAVLGIVDSLDHLTKTSETETLPLEKQESSTEMESKSAVVEDKDTAESKTKNDSPVPSNPEQKNSSLLVSNQLIGTQNLPTNHIEIEKNTKKLSNPIVKEKDIGTLTSGRLVPTPIAELQLKSFKNPNDDGAWYDIYVEPKATSDKDLGKIATSNESKKPDTDQQTASVVDEPIIVSERTPSYYTPKEIIETAAPKAKNSLSFFVSFDSDDGKPKYKIPKRFRDQSKTNTVKEVKNTEDIPSDSDNDSNEEEIEVIEVSEGDPEYQHTGGSKLQTILELDNESEQPNDLHSQSHALEPNEIIDTVEDNLEKTKALYSNTEYYEEAYKTEILTITRSVRIIERAYQRFKNSGSVESNESDLEKQNRAAKIIQKWVRDSLREKSLRVSSGVSKKCKENNAAKKIQRAYRRYAVKTNEIKSANLESQERTKKEEIAALVIQKAFRLYSQRKYLEFNKNMSTDDTELEQNNAAKKIQRAYRRYLQLSDKPEKSQGLQEVEHLVEPKKSPSDSIILSNETELISEFQSKELQDIEKPLEVSMNSINTLKSTDNKETINEFQTEELQNMKKVEEIISNPIHMSRLAEEPRRIKEIKNDEILSNISSTSIDLLQSSSQSEIISDLESEELQEIKSPEKANSSPVHTLKSADKQEIINNVKREEFQDIEKPDEPETSIQPEILTKSIKDELQTSPVHPIKYDFDGKSSAALIIQRAFRQYMERRKLENFDESSFDSITSSRITAIETSNYPTAGTTPSESLPQEATEDAGEDASEIQPKSEWFVGSTRIVPSQGVVEEPLGLETDPDPAAITSKTELDTSTQVESVETVDRTHGYGSLESKLNTGIISSEIDESLGVTSEKDNAVSSGLAGLTEASEAGRDSVEDPLLLSQSDFGGIVQSLDIASTQELVNSFLENEIEYSSNQGPFPSASLLQEVVEEPCIKKSASLVSLSEVESEPDVASQKAENTDSSMSEITGLDTLSADTIDKATVKLSKPDEVIEKMSLLRDSKSHERVSSADPSFDEPVVRPISSLQEQSSMDIEDGDIIVYNRLQRDETRESSAQSDSVVFGEAESDKIQERDLLNEEESGRVHLMRHYTIAGDDPRGLFRSVTIDDALNYVEIGENGMGINSTNSFCLDDETSENIRKKMMAYSLSETDSDYFDPRKGSKEDFDIDTAMADAMGTSTETESTIVSAATKIQAGARGFLTRRRLRRASAGTKSSTLDTKASFGNEAISESLERFIEEEAAKKIQTAYRMHTRKRKGHRKMEGISLESNLAARRQKLQRGDALRNDSTPDDENSVNSSGGQTQKSSKSGRSKTVGETKSKPDMELRWLKMRQNSMPVQIDCEVFRVIPKHMRKRIKSAEANKRK
ncbi:uncharacterized protein LOC119549852 [Drosophila subpulchrella]|uniref:uncharacterized protein LOC119549852 n=1 Tax=Drosophila subpulchrella TaxID=1486046 RepID=UPI0018A1540D|nr:uncharacterized protein LOC119549852 [Drosophila subpulchrella]